jgi:hypothetical protein
MKAKHYSNILAKFATSVIVVTVVFLISDITSLGNVDTTFAYPPPQNEFGKSIDPNTNLAPDTNHTPFTNEISSYPPPMEPTEGAIPQIEFVIPEGRVVAVRNDGRIVDFNKNVGQFADSIFEGKGFLYTLPTYPNNQRNPIPLRIIGGDDRFQIQDTTGFPVVNGG